LPLLIDDLLLALLIDTEHGGVNSSETSTELHCVTTQALVPFTATVVRISNPTLYFFFDIGYYDWIERSGAGLLLYKKCVVTFHLLHQ
jgi:hypothetical protein